ncbi:HEPN domain-containing protein [Methylocystis echinoides]|uniref:HEPN domain-containing protein n=1 Tax=Methylocystis echinoides TaxID=29468 RepID=UPI00344A369C
MCRSTSVLIASHLEGFVKDFSRSVIVDFNFFRKNFHNMPRKLQRTFCHKILFFEGVEQRHIDKRVTQLTEFFEKNSVSIDLDAFQYNENPNKNPSASVVEAVFDKIGISSILTCVSGRYFEGVFEDSINKSFLINRNIRRWRMIFYHYPYHTPPKDFKISPMQVKGRSDRTLWHDYIDTVLTRRHAVAHGDLGNEATSNELASDIMKLSVLMHAIAYGVAFAVEQI